MFEESRDCRTQSLQENRARERAACNLMVCCMECKVESALRIANRTLARVMYAQRKTEQGEFGSKKLGPTGQGCNLPCFARVWDEEGIKWKKGLNFGGSQSGKRCR